jgi:formylglycine-generating enzyme required for sulfatase activity
MKKAFLSLMLFNLCLITRANNISIQRVSLLDTNRTAKTVAVRLNISWDNSWRDSINWDAAWIFFKFKEPKDSVWRWRHGTLSKSGNYAGNSTAAMKLVVPDDLRGAFYYRQGIGSGNIKADSLRLLWNYGADSVRNIDSVEIRVFATEMVYVPEGFFSIGDGNGKERSSNSFHLKNAPNNYVTITDKWSPLLNTLNSNTMGGGNDDVALYRDGIRISGLDGLDINGDKVAEYKDFPTGYRAFYSMKYEVTQGQYADFLNTLSLRDTNNLWMGSDTTRLKKLNAKHKLALQNLDPYFYSTPVETYRHTISLDTVEVRYRVSRPDRAFGQAGTNFLFSFADWSGLRPMTELEFEKACRGPLPPYFWNPTNNFGMGDTARKWSGADWAWGNDTSLPRISNMYGSSNNSILRYSGLENGTETFSNYDVFKRYINPVRADAMMGMINVGGGDGGTGPFRVGIFANDTSSRISSGASYYGIMDLSKNVAEYVISIGSNNSRAISYKVHGDGMLDAYGQTRDFISNTFSGPGNSTIIQKQESVSQRNGFGGQGINGFRVVRTAPADN